MEEREDTIILLDEDGNEIEFELVITIEYEDKEYALLKNVDDDSDDMFAFLLDTDDQGDVLIPIEDDEEIEAIQELYNDIVNDNN